MRVYAVGILNVSMYVCAYVYIRVCMYVFVWAILTIFKLFSIMFRVNLKTKLYNISYINDSIQFSLLLLCNLLAVINNQDH